MLIVRMTPPWGRLVWCPGVANSGDGGGDYSYGVLVLPIVVMVVVVEIMM